MAVLIRDAVEADMAPIQANYAWHVLNGLASFEEVPPDEAEITRRWRDVRARDLPYLVAEIDGAVVGYAYASPYRTRSAYRHTLENSVYVDRRAYAKGVGRALLAELIARCERLGFAQMIAVIGDSANAASIGLHASLGFARTGLLRAVGFKHGRWVDSVIMQRALGASENLPRAYTDSEQARAAIQQPHASARELAQMNDALEQRVHERTSELRAVIRELEGFAHSLAHDLQAPARAVRGFAGVLATELGAAASPGALRILERIERNAQRMQQLIEHVLKLARAGNAPLDRASADLTALAHESIDLMQVEPMPTIAVAPLGEARVDRGLMRQVFSNLLGNAVKFTRGCDAPRIELGRQDQGGESIWFVRDNGVGFDMSRADRLFQLFQRLHRREEFEGDGIGLANVARIIDRHGGRIWAEAAPGKGATFYFTIGN